MGIIDDVPIEYLCIKILISLMGQHKRKQYKRELFLKQNPFCCYCGQKADTTDHCPPRSLFKQNIWPEGYEFPACSKCNSSARKNEAVISCLYRIELSRNRIEPDPELTKQMNGLKNNQPEIVAEWLSEQDLAPYRLQKRFGVNVGYAYESGYKTITLGRRSKEAISFFGIKLGRSLYYKYVGRRLVGSVFCKSISLIDQEKFVRDILTIVPGMPVLCRATKDLSDQFVYRYNYSEEQGAMCIVAGFKEQLGYLIFCLEKKFYDFALENSPETIQGLKDIFQEFSIEEM